MLGGGGARGPFSARHVPATGLISGGDSDLPAFTRTSGLRSPIPPLARFVGLPKRYPPILTNRSEPAGSGCYVTMQQSPHKPRPPDVTAVLSGGDREVGEGKVQFLNSRAHQSHLSSVCSRTKELFLF